jgi:uncharacterized protein YndB with AHSA1/START domain
MQARESDASLKNHTTAERKSDREVVFQRTINGPARLVFEAWTRPELMKLWWAPKASGLKMLSCEMEVRVGGTYRLVFEHPAAPAPMAFFGSYREVVPNARLVWTNDEGGAASSFLTTVTFEERGGKTLVVVSELHPSKEALEAAMAGAGAGALESYVPYEFEQLEEFIATLPRA